MIGLRTPVVAFAVAIALLLPLGAYAAKPAAKKKPDAATPVVTPEKSPVVTTTPSETPAAAPAPGEAPGTLPPPAASPFGDDGAKDTVTAKEEAEPTRSLFEGFFINFNLGYATAGGKDGPVIPDPSNSSEISQFGTFAKWAAKDCLYPGQACYSKAVTTNKGAGLAIALQIGYNIKGYVSLWADVSGHGSFGASTDLAGVGTGAAMVGFHPLRFVKKGQLPVDLKVYGGFGFFEILGYNENQFQSDAKGKAWLGTSIPFGVSSEYKFDRKGAFAMGLDLRFVAASYDKWVYNNDKDISSKLSTPETTLRFEPRVMFGWHF